MEEFDIILKDIQKVLDKHGVELRIKSEITFAKIDAKDTDTKTDSSGEISPRESEKRKP